MGLLSLFLTKDASFCTILLVITILNKESSSFLLLSELKPGKRAEVIGFESIPDDLVAFMHRLREIGFNEGTMLEVLREAPVSKDPISVRIKEATYALRKSEAALIRVRPQ